jgi:hypothetical protein
MLAGPLAAACVLSSQRWRGQRSLDPPRSTNRTNATRTTGSLSDILEETVPGYVRPNFCDYIRGSRFGA